MPVVEFDIDDETDQVISDLGAAFETTTRAETLKRAIALGLVFTRHADDKGIVKIKDPGTGNSVPIALRG